MFSLLRGMQVESTVEQIDSDMSVIVDSRTIYNNVLMTFFNKTDTMYLPFTQWNAQTNALKQELV